jgi:nucleotide-binding universal stress UspA family protein
MHWREVVMKTIDKILVSTDLSESSMAGVSYALNLARTVNAEVTVLQVLDYEDFLEYGEKLRERLVNDPTFRVPDPYLKDYQDTLHRFLEAHFADCVSSVRVREEVEVGDVDETIVLQAKELKADLIVLSAREKTGFGRFLKRSLSEKVIRKAPCPVLSIRLKRDQEKLRAA